MSKRFLDEDVLNYNPRKPGTDRHISKKNARNKALEIVFDPKGHKEYITGFRKRKQARRKEALTKLEKRERQQRIDDRAERRQSLKDQLNLDQYNPGAGDGDASDGGEDEQAKHAVKVFTTGALTSTVTVAPIAVNSDSEAEAGSGDEEGGGAGGAAEGAAPKAAPRQYPAAAPKEQYNRLTKCARKVMAKTKLKIAGKRAVGGVRGAAQSGAPKGGAAGVKGGRGKGKGKGKK